MKAVRYSFLSLIHLSFAFGSPFTIQYKCWLWDSQCLTARAQAIIPVLSEGISELNIERLDTMSIADGLHIDTNDFKSDWRNTYLQGLRNAVVDELSVDMTSNLVHLVFHADLWVKSYYIQDGYLLSLPMRGEGEVNMKFNNIQMEFLIPFEIVKVGYGRHVMDLKGYQYWFDIRNGATMHFGNLYYGNKQMSQKVHSVLNKNWKQLTTRYGRYLFDKVNDKIFNAVRIYLHSQPLEAVSLY